MKRFFKRVALGSLLLVLGLVVVLVVVLRASLPRLEGEVHAAVSAPVTVTRDANGVAFLAGENRNDIGFVLGYLHGQERFFQMDLLRRNSAGELAELFGAKALPTDRAQRVHRFRARTRQQIKTLSADQRALLRQYTAGVNAGLSALGARPFEYLVLRQTPEPWAEEDTLLVVVAMYFDLQGRIDNKEYLLTGLADVLDAEWYDFINPDGGSFDASPFGDVYPDPLLPSSELAAHLPRNIERAELDPEIPAPFGSNNWAVSGAHTSHGAALVANDMHLGLRLPHIWYRAGWTLSDGRKMQGLTLPGTPLMVVGSSEKLAWGFTNSYLDTVDVLQVKRHSDGALKTVQGETIPVQTHAEEIMIQGGESEILHVEETPYGPVIGTTPDGDPLILQWTAYSPHGLNMGLIGMEQMSTVQEALDAAPDWGLPTQNLVVGDSGGSIGWTPTGPLPTRTRYVDSITQHPWIGYNTDTNRPRLLNPESGRIWTANSRVVNRAFDQQTGNGSYAVGARAGQIRDLLMAKNTFDEADFMAIGLDNRALFLTRWYEQLRLELQNPELQNLPALKTISAALEDWSGRADGASKAHLAVSRFRTQFHAQTLGRIYAEAVKPYGAQDKARLMDEYALWALVHHKPENGLLPDYENWTALLRDVLTAVAADITHENGTLKTWGDHNYLKMAHPFADLMPFLKPWLAMDPVPLSGDDFMPNVLRTKGSNVSERMFVSPGHEDSAVLHIPGGQAGHPMSPYWAAGHEEWLNGTLSPMSSQTPEWTLHFQALPPR